MVQTLSLNYHGRCIARFVFPNNECLARKKPFRVQCDNLQIYSVYLLIIHLITNNRNFTDSGSSSCDTVVAKYQFRQGILCRINGQG